MSQWPQVVLQRKTHWRPAVVASRTSTGITMEDASRQRMVGAWWIKVQIR